jgi:hypothetical protein
VQPRSPRRTSYRGAGALRPGPVSSFALGLTLLQRLLNSGCVLDVGGSADALLTQDRPRPTVEREFFSVAERGQLVDSSRAPRRALHRSGLRRRVRGRSLGQHQRAEKLRLSRVDDALRKQMEFGTFVLVAPDEAEVGVVTVRAVEPLLAVSCSGDRGVQLLAVGERQLDPFAFFMR